MRLNVLLSAAALVAFSFNAEAKMADASASKADCMVMCQDYVGDDFLMAVCQDRCVGHAACNANHSNDKEKLTLCRGDVERKADTALKGKKMNAHNAQGKIAVVTDADQSNTGLFDESDGKGANEQ